MTARVSGAAPRLSAVSAEFWNAFQNSGAAPDPGLNRCAALNWCVFFTFTFNLSSYLVPSYIYYY